MASAATSSPGLLSRAGMRQRLQARGLFFTIALGVLVAHIVGLALFGLYIVAVKFKDPVAQFQAEKSIVIPLPPPDHKMRMQKHEAMASPPVFQRKLVSINPAAFPVPEVPPLEIDEIVPMDPSDMIGNGFGGRGNGLGRGGSGGSTSFFDVTFETKSIALLFDVSGSVVNKANAAGLSLDMIKTETLKLVDSLPVDCRFGLFQFVRNYKPFRRELVPATTPNKTGAKQWVEEEWDDSGMMSASGKGVVSAYPNGLPFLLDHVLAMGPDTVWIVSDGSFQRSIRDASGQHQHDNVDYKELRTLIRSHAEKSGLKVRVNFLGFQMKDEDKRGARAMAAATEGIFKEFSKRAMRGSRK